MAKRIINVITGSRAEFGLMRPLCHAIAKHEALQLRLVATGTHLITGSIADIDAEFDVAARLPMQESDKVGRSADVRALSRGVAGLGEDLAHAQPDFVVVLGDRIEAMAGALAGSVGGVRVAHLHGGDRAEGVADEAMRHAISKLAHLHFPATAQSRRRLIRMGEDRDTVFNVGSLAIDGLREVEPMPDAQLQQLGVPPDRSPTLVMQHPVGASDDDERQWMTDTLAATSDRPRIVFAPNRDPGSEGIRAAIAAAGMTPIEHLPRAQFIGLLKRAAAIVGNSSAALIECATLKLPAVNVGPRQRGREMPRHVVNCAYGRAAVHAALEQAMTADLSRMRHPYGDGRTAECIAEHLATVPLDRVPLRKCNAY